MQNPKGKVLVIVGDATETVDTLYPYYRLIEAGFQPVVASHEKRRYQMVLHEIKPGWTITKEWEGYSIEAEIAFKDIKPEEYVGIFFSGGRAPEYIREDEALLSITRWFWEHQKPMASVCHGVEIPARAGIGLRHQHYRAVVESRPPVGWLEVPFNRVFPLLVLSGSGAACFLLVKKLKA